jgi:pyridinium-3,5-bisthiocarboxylic acid mononucleotide nickel chelatase
VTTGSQRIAWFHCFCGIAGDMALGSLLDAGAELDEVMTLLRRLPIGGWRLEAQEVLRGGISCTRALVTVDDDDHHGRTHRDIAALVGAADLPERVTRRALDTFSLLAQVEGRLHARPPAAVHFHEVGGHDAVVDVVGTAAALEVLGIDAVTASAVAVGTGTVRAAHGILPNPPPAVLRLLEGIPTVGRDLDMELTTPTGAALLRSLASGFGGLPPMVVEASGYGAGGRELPDLPNCTQVVVGTATVADSGPGQPLSELAVNLDDVTGEQLARTVAALIQGGAHDAWITPAVMKKGRPGHVVHALCDPATAAGLREILRRETGSWGVRSTHAHRWPGARHFDQVTVTGEVVAVKVGQDRVKPEPDDVARLADRLGIGLAEAAARVAAAWSELVEEAGPAGA